MGKVSGRKIEMSNEQISFKVLRKLPPGKPLCIKELETKDGEKVVTVKWMWIEQLFGCSNLRIAHFNLENGNYIGEA